MRSSLLLATSLALSSVVASSRPHSNKLAHRATLAAQSEEHLSSLTKRTVKTSKKKGLGYDTASLTVEFGSSLAWVYHWADIPEGALTDGVEFVPMLWGASSVSGFTPAVKDALSSGSSHILGFNEPDEVLADGGSDMTVSTAASLYKEHVTPFKARGIYLISPAVTNGAAPMGLTWLSSFLSSCSDCKITGIALHWYDSATNFAYFQSYFEGAHEQFPDYHIWITEFGATGTEGEVSAFLKEAIPWMEAQPWIVRYSYEGDFAGTFVNADGSLTALGKVYKDTV